MPASNGSKRTWEEMGFDEFSEQLITMTNCEVTSWEETRGGFKKISKSLPKSLSPS